MGLVSAGAVKMTVDKRAEIYKAIEEMSNKRAMVGVPAQDALRRPEPGQKSDINNAALAYIHENGAPEAHIPPRPFLIPGVKSIQGEIERRLNTTAQAALQGKPAAVDKGLNAVGLVAQAAVRAKITDGPFTPLAPRTLAARKARGRTGTKPLIDTGQLRNAITYVIRKVRGI